jgi:hypothetical protein
MQVAPPSDNQDRGRKPLSARHILTAVLVAAAAVALLGSTADPDLWGHVRFGQDILASHDIPGSDPYSFTSDRRWINHEWLAEVAMALAFNIGGASGLNLLRLFVIGLTLALVWSHLSDVDELLRLQLVAVAGVGMLLRVHPFRPQVFSVLLFALMLWLILRAERRNSITPLIAVPLTMMAWVNLHGGWIVGIGTLGFWIAATSVFKRPPLRRVALLALVGVAACLTTLVNPYGLDMWRFLADTVRVERPMISDWQPTFALPLGFAALWLIPAGVAIGAVVRARDRVDWTRVVLVALFGFAALRVSRLDAFFALATVFLLGPYLSRAGESVTRLAIPATWISAWRLTLVTMLVVIVAVGVWQLPRINVGPGSPEPDAAHFIRDQRLEGRMLTWFDWGEYAIWHLSPRIRVSIDGRRETVYTNDVVSRHLAFYAGMPGSEDYADLIGADYIWLPRGLPVVQKLRARGWHGAFEGPVSVVLMRSEPAEKVHSTTPNSDRMFPGL